MLRSIDANIASVESRFGRVFNDKSLCATALQMQMKNGVTLNFGGSDQFIEHNEILELVGDSIIDTVLCKKWVQTRKKELHNLAMWSELRESLAGNAALGKRGLLLGLDAVIIKAAGTTVGPKMMANTFEAIIGAVFLDAGDEGLKAVHDVLEHIEFFNHPMLQLPDMEDSRIGEKRNSVVAYEKGPKAPPAVY